jgi:hypothetical protein
MGKRVTFLVGLAIVLGICSASWAQKKASNPNPADGATDVMAPVLRWTAGSTSAYSQVYLGTTPNLGPAQLVAPKVVGAVRFYFYPMGFQAGVTYYWRVDEVESDGVTTYTGDVWMFIGQPLTAFWPDPADGSNAGPVQPNLTWRAGLAALKHQVYFGDNRDAVAAGSAEVDKGLVSDPNYAPGVLQPLTTYYWRVDEILATGGTATGPVWTFTTFLGVDDFERYNDEENKGTRIYETWIDGYADGSSGSTVGYIDPPFAEQKVVRSGKQSMPFDYNNITAPFYSEAKLEFSPLANWTVDVNVLVVHVRGEAVDYEIEYTSRPPVIDGKVDDIWVSVKALQVRDRITGDDTAQPTAADCSAQFRELYDATNLYVLVDVNDDKLYNDSGSHYLDDSVEVYFDGGNTKGPGAPLSGDDRQYTFGWSATDVQGTNFDATGVEFAQVNVPGGWRIEIKLPWQTLMGTSAPVGKLVGIDCFYNDDDNGADTRESQIAWHSTSSGDWQVPASWGTALVARPAATGGADRLYVMLQDSANKTATVTHPDTAILKSAKWVEWQIPLSDFAGVNLGKVKWLYLGVGDRANPVAGGAGKLYFDDIYLTKPAPQE